MERLANKTAIITGAARGLGAAMAERFVQEGCQVVVSDINGVGATETAKRLSVGGRPSVGIQADVTKRADVEKLFADARDQVGPVDIIVNNAGIFGNARFEDMTDDEWKTMMAVNVDGVFLVTQTAVREWLSTDRPGNVINMASISANVSFTDSTHYSASKAAVAALTRCLAAEFGPRGIRVNSISPGLIATDMTAPALAVPELAEAWTLRIPNREWGTPTEVASVAAFLASDDASYVNGAEIVVDGGASVNFPKPSDAVR